VNQLLHTVFNNAKVRILIPPITGFLFYGAWALLINSEHGWMPACKAALTQGSYSFIVTLILALLIEWLFVRLNGVKGRSLWVLLFAVLILAITSSTLNFVAGTPNILWTILPGLLVSSVYSVLYIAALNRLL